MRLATITENSVDPQDIELAKLEVLEVPTIKDLIERIQSLPADTP